MRCNDIEFDNGFFTSLRSEPVCFFKTILVDLNHGRYFVLYICFCFWWELFARIPEPKRLAIRSFCQSQSCLFFRTCFWCPCDGPSIFTRQDTDFFGQEGSPRKSCAEFQFSMKGFPVGCWVECWCEFLPETLFWHDDSIWRLSDHFCKESIEWQFWNQGLEICPFIRMVEFVVLWFFFVWQDIFGQFCISRNDLI